MTTVEKKEFYFTVCKTTQQIQHLIPIGVKVHYCSIHYGRHQFEWVK
jgi:hypothetical protein